MYTKWSVQGGLLSVHNCVDPLPSGCLVIRNVVLFYFPGVPHAWLE
jgi:hypothetical protein